jgi:hypothetical protein
MGRWRVYWTVLMALSLLVMLAGIFAACGIGR